MFTVDYDEATGLIRCDCGGFLTVADVLQLSKEVREAVEESRQKFGCFKLMTVAIDSVLQSPEVVQAVQENKAYITGPRDRSAIVTPSALAKAQADRSLKDARERVFPSEQEAMAWLMAEEAD